MATDRALSRHPFEMTESLANEIIDGKGYALLPDLISRADAAAARALLLAADDTPLVPGFASRNQKIHQRTSRKLLHLGEIFEQLVQHPAIIEAAEALLGDDMTLSAYSARILEPGALEMGVHIDYPYWAMRGPFSVRPPLMVQVVWMMQDFTEDNGATLVAPSSQLRGTQPDRERFAREAIKITGSAGAAMLSHGLLWHDTSRNRTTEPRVAILINYGAKVIRPMDSTIADVPPAVLERATPKLRQLLGLDFSASLGRNLRGSFSYRS